MGAGSSAVSRPAVLLLIAVPLLACLPATVSAATSTSVSPPAPPSQPSDIFSGLRKRDAKAYDKPSDWSGSMLTWVNNTYPAGLGEPLNLIVSGESDPDVLVESADNGGFLNYMLSTNLGEECLNLKLGSSQKANLGDGHGDQLEQETLRWNYGNPYLGSCRETFEGGLHLRYWRQQTTGAFFLASSVEMGAALGHDIVVDGYNIGRDQVVGNLTGTTIEPRTVTNQSTFSGSTSFANYTYQTDVAYVSGLLSNSSDGVNHYLTVEGDGYPAIDGLVAVLTVKITGRPEPPPDENAASPAKVLSGFAVMILTGITTLSLVVLV